MHQSFSLQLIARAQRIFEKRSGRSMSTEEAGMLLERLAQIGFLMQRVAENEKRKGGENYE